VVLCYKGLTPPVVFAHGNVASILGLIKLITNGEFQISLRDEVLSNLPATLEIVTQIAMWRMWFARRMDTRSVKIKVAPLTIHDREEIADLYRDKIDAPDGYHHRQLDMGPFVGVKIEDNLVATAGIHVLSKTHNLAALGNIYTHPDFRQRGFAYACTSAVITMLEDLGIHTIVLNVSQANLQAIRLYETLGFEIHCPFFEGIVRKSTE
jgi:ribosomal protein S18 acetylase RimI-like enzyme